MNRDFLDLLRELTAADARFLIVGAYAVAVHGRPRATNDLDVWVAPTPENARRVFDSLARFGAALGEVTVSDFTAPDLVFQIGVPPNRVDVMTSVSGVGFEEAWNERVTGRFGDLDVPVIGREALIRNKRATGRHKDLGDVEGLERQPG